MSKNLPQFEGFETQRLLGEGATSSVYLASRGGKLYAIKAFKGRDQSKIQQELLSFRKEGAVMARVKHPGIIQVFEVHEKENAAYLVMEYVEGESLERMLQSKVMPESEWLPVVKTLAQALGTLHVKGIVHRDIKPDNILLTQDGKPKLIDFGFAVEVTEKEQSKEAAAGTLLYSSPEQMGVLQAPCILPL